MTEAFAWPFREQAGNQPEARPGRLKPPTDEAQARPHPQPIEITAPDRYTTTLLLEYASPLFTTELISDNTWTVRLHPPRHQPWALQLLALLDRWLHSARLPHTNVHYNGHDYEIRATAAAAAQGDSP